MSYHLVYSKTFRKSLKRLSRSGDFDALVLKEASAILESGETLPKEYKDHGLGGKFIACRECHLRNDLLLIYEIDNSLNMVTMVDIGSHSQLFG